MADATTPVTIEMSVDLQTDPLGGSLNATVPDAASDNGRRALLDDIEHKLVGQRNNLVYRSVQKAHDRLQLYGGRMDYAVEPIIDSFAGVDVDRSNRSLSASWHWDHEGAKFMEWGTSDHEIQGQPVLSFIWRKEDAPRWVKKQFEREGSGYRVFFGSVDVAGLPASRFVRESLNWLRRELRS